MRQLTFFIQCSNNFKNRMGYSWGIILGSCSWKFDEEILTDRRVRIESNE
jgi:hypothetical protein